MRRYRVAGRTDNQSFHFALPEGDCVVHQREEFETDGDMSRWIASGDVTEVEDGRKAEEVLLEVAQPIAVAAKPEGSRALKMLAGKRKG